VAELFLALTFWVIHWVIVLPVSLALCTPWFVLVTAFEKDSYWVALARRYRSLVASFAKFWDEGGWGFTP